MKRFRPEVYEEARRKGGKVFSVLGNRGGRQRRLSERDRFLPEKPEKGSLK